MDEHEATQKGLSVGQCQGPREAEQVSRLTIEGYFYEPALIELIRAWAQQQPDNRGVWRITCSRFYPTV